MYQIIGVISSFVGSFLLAITVITHPSAYYEDKGKKRPMALVRGEKLFKLGLPLLCVGFFLQFISLLVK